MCILSINILSWYTFWPKLIYNNVHFVKKLFKKRNNLLLTGYAVSFNCRHRRHGQLFQNRYKSILCVDIALNGWSNAWQNYLTYPRRSCCQVVNMPKQSKLEALYVTGGIENLGWAPSSFRKKWIYPNRQRVNPWCEVRKSLARRGWRF